jgi:hypothetical protein
MDIHRNSTAVVLDRHRLVGVNGDRDVGAVTGERFVDGVIEDLKHHVVEARSVVGVADVHAGPLADGVEALQDFDFAGVVDVRGAHGVTGLGRCGIITDG